MSLLALLTLPALAASEQDFLPPEQAFRFSVRADAPDAVALHWQVAPGYYMYREQFRFASDPAGVPLGEPEIPRGHIKYDATFERDVETLRDAVNVRLPLLPSSATPLVIVAVAQGCADAGLCYPPTEYRVRVDRAGAGAPLTVSLADAAPGGAWSDIWHADDVGLADILARGGLLQTVFVFLGLGVLLALTPCVLPMVPILSAILVGDSARSSRPRLRGLGLAAIYVTGMSLVYTAAGVLAGMSGESLAASLQTPWVLGVFAAILAVLALAMFDMFTFQLPAAWQSSLSARVSRLPGGRATGAFAMGALSALIVGPCVAAPLAGALLYISQTRDVLLGGLALFALAWGMGVPLLVAGASAGAFLPRTGPWMDGVKRFFAMLLLAVAWWMLWPVLPTAVQMLGWAALAIMAAAMLGAFNSLPAEAVLSARLRKGLGLMFALLGILQAVGVASGGRDPLQPLAHLTRSDGGDTARLARADTMAAPPQGLPSETSGAARGLLGEAAPGMSAANVTPEGPAWLRDAPATGAPSHFTRVRTVAELDAAIAASPRPVMLDFYADWCVSCKEMEALTFPQPQVAERLAGFTLLQVDVTANNADDKALLKRFKLFGPPGIVFFAPGGRPINDVRVIGFQGAPRFASNLDRVLTAAR